MFRAFASTTTSSGGVCRLFFIQVRNTTAAAASKTNAPDTKEPDLKHVKREGQHRIKTFSIYRWVICTTLFSN
jgi:hypothetical protein